MLSIDEKTLCNGARGENGASEKEEEGSRGAGVANDSNRDDVSSPLADDPIALESSDAAVANLEMEGCRKRSMSPPHISGGVMDGDLSTLFRPAGGVLLTGDNGEPLECRSSCGH